MLWVQKEGRKGREEGREAGNHIIVYLVKIHFWRILSHIMEVSKDDLLKMILLLLELNLQYNARIFKH